jgi:hypothetical protein
MVALTPEQDGHAIMNASREVIGNGDNQRATENCLVGLRVFLFIPETGNRKHSAVRCGDEIRLLASLGRSPSVIAGR